MVSIGRGIGVAECANNYSENPLLEIILSLRSAESRQTYNDWHFGKIFET